MNAKPLTEAQQRKLAQLNDMAITAQAQLADFVAYLRDEHDAPEERYTLTDIAAGFVAIESEDVRPL